MSVQPSRIKVQRSKSKDQVSAILLAAGQSRRMGAFKPLLPFGERTVIETCVEGLRAAGVNQIVVVVGHRADEVRAQLKNFDLSFAVNPDPGSEMSASIARGIEQIGSDVRAVLFALVDHPAVAPEAIRALIDEWRNGATLAQPTYKGHGGHPVLIDASYRDELIDLDPERGLRGLFQTHRDELRRIEVACPFVARDMDTWEHYLRIHKEVFGSLPRD